MLVLNIAERSSRCLKISEIVKELLDEGIIKYYDRNFVAPRLTELKEAGKVLEAMYLTENVGVPDDVADAEHINTRTVFKDLNVAIQDLSGLFFGIDLSDIILF